MLEIENFTEEDKNKLEQYMLNDENLKTTKVKLNLKESNVLCSWKQAKKLNDIEDNQLSGPIDYVERVVATYKRILVLNEKQVRTQLVDQDNATQVVNPSLDVFGWLHELAPIVAITMEDAVKQRIIEIGDSRIEKYDYVLIFGFTRHQEMGKLGWDECIVDIVRCSPLVQREIGLDSNLHIGKQGKPNTSESIGNQALRAVENEELTDDDDIVREWIYKRARDRKNPETIFEYYKERRPSSGPMRTFHSDPEGPNSIVKYAEAHNLPYGGDENSNYGYGIICKSPKSKAQWKITENTITENPESEELTYALWVPKPNLKTLEDDRKKQKKSAEEFLDSRAEFVQTIIKRVKEKGGDLSKKEDIKKHGFRVKIKHVAQDITTKVEGGELKEQGFID